MPDKKLTDNEIIKALECCIDNTDKSCSMCVFAKTDYSCVDELQKNALDLINILQAEKQNLEIELKSMRGAANSYKAEHEKYEDIKEQLGVFWNLLLKLSIAKRKEKPTLEEFAEVLQEYKTEVRKEFAERLKEDVKFIPWCDYPPVHNCIDDLLRVMGES